MARPQVNLGLDNSALQSQVLNRLLQEGTRKKQLERGLTLQSQIYDAKATTEQKRAAALEMQQLGFSVDRDLLEPKIDLTPLFDAYGYPEELRKTTQDVFDQKSLTGNGVMEELQKFGTRKPGTVSVEMIRQMQEIGGFAADDPMATMEPGKVKAQLDFVRTTDDYARTEMMKHLSAFSKPGDKLTESEAKQQAYAQLTTDADGNQIPLSAIMKDPAKLGDLQTLAGLNPGQVMALYGADASMYGEAEKSIMRELTGGDPTRFTFLAQKQLPRPANWDEYVDETNSLRPEKIVQKANKIQQAIIDQSDIAHIDISRVPAEDQSIVTNLIADGFTSSKAVREQFDRQRNDPSVRVKMTREQELRIEGYFPNVD